ncbi:hemerythrin domain-containing protein [Streptacidiphilus sp. MAP5-3]|uniref:hemerythrin domain-containing protein n=1 Tax=unclassified Streptacidiphilus TaxID=2643834 RepID=UPI003519D0DE
MAHPPFTTLHRSHQTMLLAHRAMSRDLECLARAAAVLAERPDAARARALAKYADQLLHLIEHHHTGEDDVLWPELAKRGADPEALELMAAEHGELAELLQQTGRAAADLTTDHSAALRLSAAASDTHSLLTRHAADEEDQLLGRLAPHLTDEVWDALRKHMMKTQAPWALTFLPPWLAAVATPEERSGVPAPLIAKLGGSRLRALRRAAFGEELAAQAA